MMSKVRYVAFLLLVIPAVLRTLVLISPDPWFSFNPLQLTLPADGIGPAGSLTLDLLSSLGFILAIVSSGPLAGRFERILLISVVVPVIAIGVHLFAWPNPFVSIDAPGLWSELQSTRISLADEFGIRRFTLKHPENLLLGSSWVAAWLTGVGAYFLSRDHHLRVLFVGSVVALAAPFAVKAVYQVVVEHPMTVESFEQTRDAVFRSHGWDPDSVQARLYIRRLEQPEATGWFGLSNVFGTFAAGLTVFWIGLTMSAARTRLASGWIGLLGLVAIGSVAALILTFSKGAIAAGVVGIALVFGVVLPRRYRQRMMPWTAGISIGLIVLALVGVVLRGWMLGEAFKADGYSLYFRWQYWIGAFRAFIAKPIFGTGPEGFKSAYVILKPLTSPEEVASPHSVFVSWLATLGIFGIGWVWLILALLKRAAPFSSRGEANVEEGESAAKSNREWASSDQPGPSNRAMWALSIMVGVVALGTAWWLNYATMYPDFAFLFWPVAMGGYIGLMGLLPWIGRHSSWVLLRWCVWSTVTVVFVHSQIEMSMTRTGAAAAFLLLLGASAISRAPAASGASVRGGRFGVTQAVVAAVSVILLTGFVLTCWVPTVRQQGVLRRASSMLAEVGELRQSMSIDVAAAPDFASMRRAMKDIADRLDERGVDAMVDGRLRELDAAFQARNTSRLQELRLAILVDLEFAIKKLELLRIGGDGDSSDDDRRAGAIQLLEEAAAIAPFNPVPWEERIRLWMILAQSHDQANDVPRCTEALDQAEYLALRLTSLRPDKASHFLGAYSVAKERAAMLDEAQSLANALTYLHAALQLDPHNIHLVQRAVELYQELDRPEDARRMLERALEIDANLRLDPLKQLTEQERAAIRSQLQAIGGGG